MAEPRWAQWTERRDAANNSEGREDVFNRAVKDFYGTFGVEHNDDGTHKLAGLLYAEQGTYTGTGAGQIILLTALTFTIKFLLISRPDTEAPVFISDEMTTTKQIGTNAFQAGMITDITTAGQFTVGADAAVDAVGITYSYLALGLALVVA